MYRMGQILPFYPKGAVEQRFSLHLLKVFGAVALAVRPLWGHPCRGKIII